MAHLLTEASLANIIMLVPRQRAALDRPDPNRAGHSGSHLKFLIQNCVRLGRNLSISNCNYIKYMISLKAEVLYLLLKVKCIRLGAWTWQRHTLQFILPMAGEEVDLLKWRDADPSGLRIPFEGSILTALSGSMSTENLLIASWATK